jgi:hypothetical protein
MPGTTTESQKRASHRRYHLNKGVVKSSCELCIVEHPELGADIRLNPEPTVEIIRGPSGDPIEGARVIVQPVLQAPDPDRPLTEQFEKDRLYQWAALNRSVEEVAVALGCSATELTEKISSMFGVTWEQLSARAFNECSFEVMANLYARAKGGDARFVLLFTKLARLPEFRELGANAFVRTVLPSTIERNLRSMSTEELLKKREELLRVVDRKPQFQDGPLSDTLEIIPTRSGNALSEQALIHKERDEDTAEILSAIPENPYSAVKKARADLETSKIETRPEPQALDVNSNTRAQGPCVYTPDAAEPLRL